MPCDIAYLRKDFGILHFHCMNNPSFSNPSIIKCLADYARLSHRLLSALDTFQNQENIRAHCKKIGAILGIVRRGELLTQEEKELSKRDGNKSMSELEDEVCLVQTPSFDRFVIKVAAFAKLCAEEAERQSRVALEAEKGEVEKEDEDEDEEGDSNSTIKATLRDDSVVDETED